jgi:hypothetical protein
MHELLSQLLVTHRTHIGNHSAIFIQEHECTNVLGYWEDSFAIAIVGHVDGLICRVHDWFHQVYFVNDL